MAAICVPWLMFQPGIMRVRRSAQSERYGRRAALVVGELRMILPDAVARHVERSGQGFTPLRNFRRFAPVIGRLDGLTMLELADGDVSIEPAVAVIAGPFHDNDVVQT